MPGAKRVATLPPPSHCNSPAPVNGGSPSARLRPRRRVESRHCLMAVSGQRLPTACGLCPRGGRPAGVAGPGLVPGRIWAWRGVAGRGPAAARPSGGCRQLNRIAAWRVSEESELGMTWIGPEAIFISSTNIFIVPFVGRDGNQSINWKVHFIQLSRGYLHPCILDNKCSSESFLSSIIQ